MSHRCPWPGCDETVASSQYACRAHWRALPSNTRAWIGRAYRHGIMTGTHPTQSWRDAHAAATAWMQQHGGQP